MQQILVIIKFKINIILSKNIFFFQEKKYHTSKSYSKKKKNTISFQTHKDNTLTRHKRVICCDMPCSRPAHVEMSQTQHCQPAMLSCRQLGPKMETSSLLQPRHTPHLTQLVTLTRLPSCRTVRLTATLCDALKM